MDSDSFTPAFWRAARILGLEKVVSKVIEATTIILNAWKFGEEEPVRSHLQWIYKVKNAVVAQFTSKLAKTELVELLLEATGVITALMKETEQKGIARLSLFAGNNLNKSIIRATVSSPKNGTEISDEYVVQVIDSKGGSSFPQLPAIAKRFIISGQIQGTTGTVLIGTGFTCTRTAVGQYTIKFEEELPSVPVGIATHCNNEKSKVVSVNGEANKKEIKFSVYGGVTMATLNDEDFNFMVMG